MLTTQFRIGTEGGSGSGCGNGHGIWVFHPGPRALPANGAISGMKPSHRSPMWQVPEGWDATRPASRPIL